MCKFYTYLLNFICIFARDDVRTCFFTYFFGFFFFTELFLGNSSFMGCRKKQSKDMITTRGNHFQFGSVFIKKNNQTEIKKKKPKPNRTGSNRLVSVRFFRTKPVWLGFGSVFSVLLGFFGLGWFWLGFFSNFFSVWVRFGVFGYRFIKLKPNRSVFSKF